MKHPIKGKYYLLDDHLVQVMEVKVEKIKETRRIKKEHWFQATQYEKTGKVKEYVREVWWWIVGDNKLPGKGMMHTSSYSHTYDWASMHHKARVLINQSNIILTDAKERQSKVDEDIHPAV